MLTYVSVRSASRRGFFLVLHPNIALSEFAFGWRSALSKPRFRLVTYGLVRACVTADDKSQALPHLRRCLIFHIRCSLSRRENAEALASFLVPAELSRSSLIFTPRKTRAKPSFVIGSFAHGVPAESIFGGVNLIQMTASDHKRLIRSPRTRRTLLRRRFYAPLECDVA